MQAASAPGVPPAPPPASPAETAAPRMPPAATMPPPLPPGAPRGPSVRPRWRRYWPAAVALLLVALLVGGGVAAALLLSGGQRGTVELPDTAAELSSSVATCEKFLNEDGRNLLGGRAGGASVYSVKARLDPVANTMSGEETVLFTNRTEAALGSLVFRVYANSAGLQPPGKPVVVREVKADGREAPASLKGSFLTVTLPSPLAPRARTVASLSFEESVPEVKGTVSGLEDMLKQQTAGGYGVFGHDRSVYDLGYFMPLLTRCEGGSWSTQEAPAFGDVCDYDSAYFNVSLDAPGGWQVTGTGVQTGRRESGGRVTYAFAGGPTRDFALQASPDYASVSRSVGPTTVTSWYMKGADEGGRRAARFACDALARYNRHFGPYPYTRLDVCEAPLSGGAAGMEFTGLVQISQMLYGAGAFSDNKGLGEKLDSLLDSLGGALMGDSLEFVVSHEVCHQWWGLVVGSDSIEHPWQDESLTNYSSVLYFRWQHGEDAAKSQLQTQITLPYQAASLLGGGDTVVDSPVSAFKNEEQYVAAVYSKGALFFAELEKKMGAAAFEKSLTGYYRGYAFLNATPDELMAAFERNASDAPAVSALHQRWIKEKHAADDIAADLPGANLLEDLLKDLPDLDLGPYQDMLKEFMDQFDRGGSEQSPPQPLPGESPEMSI